MFNFYWFITTQVLLCTDFLTFWQVLSHWKWSEMAVSNGAHEHGRHTRIWLPSVCEMSIIRMFAMQDRWLVRQPENGPLTAKTNKTDSSSICVSYGSTSGVDIIWQQACVLCNSEWLTCDRASTWYSVLGGVHGVTSCAAMVVVVGDSWVAWHWLHAVIATHTILGWFPRGVRFDHMWMTNTCKVYTGYYHIYRIFQTKM